MTERALGILNPTNPATQEITERNLVGRAKLGDESALAGLYEKYHPRVYSYVLARTSNQHVAEDLTQDIFLKLIESIQAFEQRGVPFSAWVFRIAHNHIVSNNRKGGKKKSYVFSDVFSSEINAISTDSPEGYVEKQDTFGRIVKTFAELSQRQNDVISLRFLAGLTVAETAQALGIADGHVKCAQHRGISNLRKKLNQNGSADMLESSIDGKAG